MTSGTGLDAIAVHESGHLLAGWVYGLEIRGGHTVRTSQYDGVSYVAEGIKEVDPLNVAVVMVCGRMAEKMLRGRGEKFNWLRQDHDATYARLLTDDGPDRPGPRQLPN